MCTIYSRIKKAKEVNSPHYILRLFLMFSIIIFSGINLYAENKVPMIETKKNYSQYIEDLKNNITDIDYTDFRHSFYNTTLEEGGLNVAGNKLWEEILMSYNNGEFDHAEEAVVRFLDSNYSSMNAHHLLSLLYKKKNEGIKYEKHRAIVQGLLSSVLDSGDGMTPATAWKVIEVSEEYFILDVLNAERKTQALISSEPVCDEMTVEINGEEYTFYFDISLIMQRYSTSFDNK